MSEITKEERAILIEIEQIVADKFQGEICDESREVKRILQNLAYNIGNELEARQRVAEIVEAWRKRKGMH